MTLAHHLLRRARSIPRYELPVEGTEATRAALSNFAKNVAALERVWPRTVLALPDAAPELEWLYARDGTLSARHVDRRWVNDVSVPRKAAERMLARLTINGTTAVMLAPTHAAQLRCALAKLPPQASLIVVIPGETNAGVIVACDDFSDEIHAKRLWLAVGPDWEIELKAILDANDGLAPATTMIRVPGLNQPVVDLILRNCDVLLSQHAKSHVQLTAMSFAKPRFPRTPIARVCVATSSFQTWDDSGPLLKDIAEQSGLSVSLHDTSLAHNASSLRFARTSEGCDAVIMANAGRADLPGLVPDNVPWLTWATRPRVPACVATATRDVLVIVDASMSSLATAAGWPASRVIVAAEPIEAIPLMPHACPAMIVDLAPVVPPASVIEMSSHRVVWDAIERELTEAPLAARADVDAYVLAWADRVGVPRASFPLEVFRESLVMPLFARELAKTMHKAGVSFEIHGKGWDVVPELAGRWRGTIETRDAMRSAIGCTTALLDVWPGAAVHRARRTSRRVVTTWGRTLQAITADAAKTKPASSALPSFDLQTSLAAIPTHPLNVAA